ncbi:MAG TPA: peptidyl-prolyl cis-trans isomerase, partial [Phycisphaerae bacterium]|nr:peptidyl-prolyl cis-trans isomerase [Phycisphaerae bacterium]
MDTPHVPKRKLHCDPRGLACALAVLILVLYGACATPEPAKPADTVLDAWQKAPPRKTESETQAKATPPPTPIPDLIGDANSNGGPAIAYVDGRPIARKQVVDLLLAGHGVGILEQAVVLEKAKVMAADQGIAVTQADIDKEFERSLRNLTSPLRAAGDQPFDREEAEDILDEVLSRRNVSRAECMAMIERNAYLRAICNANMTFTDEQYVEEYQRAFGPRVQVRHIQVASLGDAEDVLEKLAAGNDFAEIAKVFSANLTTAPGGGLLEPFSREDPDVPAALAEAAFALDEGEVSDPVRVDQWYHVLKLVKKIPPDDRPIAEVKGELEKRLRERVTEPAMQTLYRSLFAQADIRVVDPVLAAEFARKHPERTKASP